ncbi:diaminopimelate epimerase [Corallococcus exiguus]|uniref:diaminopimelate epimerase n=1 Tax=Corallococcus TaxID=83461 RepID=UPI000EE98D9E|nr:diaminopimelate epimerase [Corallococcus sp. AB032C]NNB86205.1 diaminopimelate epimerase [Corallococcus exiguus]NNB94744.1 diaminopimelate epimerase [Corallococcus exiguus]NNC03290.1 diaminopimelate epimerase [Corallococcus exiguus]NPC47222.1 diaminopimelate epimerase [Corallococcus exiguus]RKH78732.1 diaminopimelate epimerase [Corallococcus sp. AB032C]
MDASERIFKYHGLGNDFVVLDRRRTGLDIDAEQSRWLCDRRRGIGADGVLAILPSSRGLARMVVHNSDGSIAEMCGNGLRCAVKYLVDHSGKHPALIDVETGAGVLTCEPGYGDGGVVGVDISMGPARLVAANLPSGTTGQPFVRAPVPGHEGLLGTAVNMGNPHLVLLDQPLEAAERLGPGLERHPAFPDRTNVEFVRVDEDGLTVVVWERGCGLTQACGTGACASAVAAVLAKRLPSNAWLRVTLPGGDLRIRVPDDLSDIRLRGPVSFVFEGVVVLPRAR